MSKLASLAIAFALLGMAEMGTAHGQSKELTLAYVNPVGLESHDKGIVLGLGIGGRVLLPRAGYQLELSGDLGLAVIDYIWYSSDSSGLDESPVVRARALVGLRYSLKKGGAGFYGRLAAGAELRLIRYFVRHNPPVEPDFRTTNTSLAPTLEPGLGWKSAGAGLTFGGELSLPIAFHRSPPVTIHGDRRNDTAIDLAFSLHIGRRF